MKQGFPQLLFILIFISDLLLHLIQYKQNMQVLLQCHCNKSALTDEKIIFLSYLFKKYFNVDCRYPFAYNKTSTLFFSRVEVVMQLSE